MIISHLVKIFLDYLYRPLAVFYDTVAYLVSFGRWNEWILAVAPLIKGTKVLELGFGTGHLFRYLKDRNEFIAGIDASPQMVKITKKRIHKDSFSAKKEHNASLVLAKAQQPPFCDGFFDTVVATFPSNYIFEQETLRNIHRVLNNNGVLLILLSTYPSGKTIAGRMLAWLYRITGESPQNDRALQDYISALLKKSGFTSEILWQKEKNANLLVIRAIPHKKSMFNVK